MFVTTLNPIPTVGREIRGIRLEEGGRLVTKVHTFMHRTRTKFDCFRVEMYGTTASSSARQKAGTVAAVCGFAAVVAVAGAVGFSATSTLYAPVTVTPTTFVRTAAHPQLSGALVRHPLFFTPRLLQHPPTPAPHLRNMQQPLPFTHRKQPRYLNELSSSTRFFSSGVGL